MAVNVKNVNDVLKLVKQGDLKCALVNPKLITDVLQIVVAANRAVVAFQTDKLVTKGLFTELLYNLSSSKKISVALSDFGINENNDSFLVCVIGDNDVTCEKTAEGISNEIDGTFKVPSSVELRNFSDENAILEYYKISSDELEVSNLLDSVITRIASKGYKSI